MSKLKVTVASVVSRGLRTLSAALPRHSRQHGLLDARIKYFSRDATNEARLHEAKMHGGAPWLCKDVRQDSLNLGFIGGGQMGSALCCSIVGSHILRKGSSITLTDKHQACLDATNQQINALLSGKNNGSDDIDMNNNDGDLNITFKTTRDNKEVINSDIVILSIKPQNTKAVLSDLREHWTGHELILSIMAGVTTEELESYFKPSMRQRVVRVMPNTPALVGTMAAGICKGAHANENDMKLVKDLLSTFGVCQSIEREELMDSVTGLSGSGPAYVYMFIEALADGGVKCGLSRQQSLELATQTVYGAAKMVKETGIHPAILKDQVTSPGGTAIEGVYALEDANFRHSVINAVQAATNRASVLGKK